MPFDEEDPHGECRAEIERLSALLFRWVNVAENGRYGERTAYPLRGHPLVGETKAAVSSHHAPEQPAERPQSQNLRGGGQ